ncbi:5-formyltetrahydrofolate cyclo-ligase [Paenibacillus marinisediminis]
MNDAYQQSDALRKVDIRARCKQLRGEMAAHDRLRWSESACELAWRGLQPILQKADGPLRVFGYMPFGSELDIVPLLLRLRAEGHIIYIPRTQVKEHHLSWYAWTDQLPLAQGVFGIMEPSEHALPISEQECELADIVFVPGLAFDRRGGRLGMGAGYYDRFLSRWFSLNTDSRDATASATIPILWSLIYKWQLLDEIPMEPHDVPINVIVTENELIRTRIDES